MSIPIKEVMERLDLLNSAKEIDSYALRVAMNAIERQTPIKPILKVGAGDCFCPLCRDIVGNNVWRYSFCPNCGKALDWSEEVNNE